MLKFLFVVVSQADDSANLLQAHSVTDRLSHSDGSELNIKLNQQPQCNSMNLIERLSLSPRPLGGFETHPDVTRVVMADFPTTGSSWLRMMMRRISWLVDLKSPIGAIYEEAPFVKQVAFSESTAERVLVDVGWDSSMGSVMFKTHWPADIDLEEPQLDRDMARRHNASIQFDKAVVLLRHPHAMVKSNFGRWQHPCYLSHLCIAHGVMCWAKFWQMVLAEKQKEGKVHFLRYEDLCLDPVPAIKGVFDFLGGPYGKIKSSEIHGYFHGNYTDYRECLYGLTDLQKQARGFKLDTGEETEDGLMLSMFDDSFFSSHYEGDKIL